MPLFLLPVIAVVAKVAAIKTTAAHAGSVATHLTVATHTTTAHTTNSSADLGVCVAIFGFIGACWALTCCTDDKKKH